MAQPTYNAYVISEYTVGTEKRTRWRGIGVAFMHKDGEGIDVILDAVPTGGRLTLRKPKEKPESGPEALGASGGFGCGRSRLRAGRVLLAALAEPVVSAIR
jgi:hypothetical protein